MAIKCSKCHSDNIDTARFCSNCAAPIQPSEKVSHTKTIETPKEGLTTGSDLTGGYQIIEELGKGGMGVLKKEDR
ncbi:MAG: zinc-ribbon domain-containing protein [Candidatus Aminicenantaceae bacterium]